QSGELPWGYDPAVGAGVVLRPTTDAGAKPQQLLGAMLPFFTEGRILRLFLFVGALTLPVWPLLAARRLGFPLGAHVWVAVVLIAPAWLYQNFEGFFQWGLAAFAFAAYFSPLVLVLFLRFLDQPSWGRYSAAVLSLSLVSLLHVLGPIVLAPVLLLYTCFA